MKICSLAVIVFGILTFLGCATTSVATWKSLPEIKQTSYEQAWAIIVGTIAEKYEIEVTDAAAGYLRTAWKQNPGVALVTAHASKVSVRMESKKPLKFKVMVEKGSWGTLSTAWEPKGNDEKAEKALLDELMARLK